MPRNKGLEIVLEVYVIPNKVGASWVLWPVVTNCMSLGPGAVLSCLENAVSFTL